MKHYDYSTGTYNGAQDDLVDDDLDCEYVWPCQEITLWSGESKNCSVLTREDEYCAECPTGSACEDYTSIYSVEPVSEEGYWRLTIDGDEGDCKDLAFRSHRAKCWSFAPCVPAKACLGGNECLKGYTASKCAECCTVANGYNADGSKNENCWKAEGDDDDDLSHQLLYYRNYGVCSPCPTNYFTLACGVAGLVLVATWLAWRLHKKKVDLGIIAIGIDFFQVLTLFASTDITWPHLINVSFTWLSFFNFNINITPPECAFSVSWQSKWLVIEWFPTIMFALVAFIYLVSWLYMRFIAHTGSKKIRLFRNTTISASLLLMYCIVRHPSLKPSVPFPALLGAIFAASIN